LKLSEESTRSGGIIIAVRHIESVVRLSEAHAKLYLRNEVTKEDIDVGIKTMLESFIETQKNSVAKEMRKTFKRYLWAVFVFSKLFWLNLNLIN
jgi:DNA replication licensing factor MCM2